MKRAFRPPDPGVVDENIESGKGALDAFRQGFDGSQIGDITFDDSALVAVVLDGIRNVFERGTLASAEDDARAEGGDLGGNSGADAAARAGDERDLSRQGLDALAHNRLLGRWRSRIDQCFI